MKYILYVSLLLITYSCKTKKTVETPSSKLWQSGIDTITLPVNDTITVPPYGSELVFDSSWITVGHNTTTSKSGVKKRHKKRDWASLLIGSKWQEKPSQLYEDSVGIGSMDGIDMGVSRMKLDSSVANAYKRHFIIGVTGDSTETINGGENIFFKNNKMVEYWDTLKVIVSYVDTSIEARPNVIDWKYLYYVKKRNKLFNSDNYYLDLDKKPIKTSIVILEGQILDPKN